MRSRSRVTVQVSSRLSWNARFSALQRNSAARARGVSPPQCRCASAIAEPAAISPCGRVIRSWIYFTISSGGTCKFKLAAISVMAPILCRILQTEHGILIVVSESLGIARPAQHRAQGLIRRLFVHEILEFVDEAALARRMRGAF